jgi:Flp pilus assembly secretin CpaC
MAMLAGFACALSVAGAASLIAEESAGAGKATVRINFRLGETHQGRRAVTRTVQVTAVDGSGPGRVQAGWRVPIPVHRGDDDAVRSFQYHDVGLSVLVRAEVLDDGRIWLRGHIEDSSLDDGAVEEGAPKLRTFEQELNAVVAAGEPLVIGSVAETGGASHFVEVEAEILD